jgi:ABC-2 type transport system permease protein
MRRGISIPPVRRTFGFATHARQTGAIAWTSFWTIAKSLAGLVLPAVALLLILLVPVFAKFKGVSLLPTSPLVLSKLVAPVAGNPRLPWVLIPLLIIYWAGELVWRERDAGMGEITDAAPVREWVLVVGKFLGLALVLAGWMALLIAAGVLVQTRMGYFAFELGLYLRILFGIQLIDYLIFALLILVVHAVVNHKQLGYLAAVVAYGIILFPSFLGIEHHLLIYGSGPRWSYSVISGFGSSLGPWLWFKLYWAGWALLLAVAASLLWPRGPERGWGTRFGLARRRFTRGTAGVAVTALTLILSAVGFIFYNTDVLHAYTTIADRLKH